MSGSARKTRLRPVDGLFLLNKPAGITSNRALQKIKRLFQAKKAGHTGSLDPAATGMLPLCFGEATKVCAYLLDADKTYRVVARLGEATETGDADGKVIDRATVPDLDVKSWQQQFAAFTGRIDQVPPMYSALKHDGKRLYELARQGRTVERKPRPVTIYELALLEAHGPRLVFRVRCSKGTYIRTLVEDIAAAAGTVAYTASLHREQVGDFRASDMVGLADAELLAERGPEAFEEVLLPVDAALAGLAEVRIAADVAARFLNGQRVEDGQAADAGLVRVYGPSTRFLGIAERDTAGGLMPRRVFHMPE